MERLLRDPRKSREISLLELFFDLAIIFALTQLSQRFLRDFGWENALQTAVLLGVVWWVWVGAAHTTDWLDPDRPYLQRIIIAMMFAGLVIAASVPEAFGKHGIVFAGANVAAHLVRHLSLTWTLRGHPLGTRSARAATWVGATAVLWIAGALLPATPRLVLWSVALIFDYLGVGIGWRVLGLRPVAEEHLRVLGNHVAERYRQIFIIAVGEVVLTSGITLTETQLDIIDITAFTLAFGIAGLIAWSFFLPRGLVLGEALDRRPPSVAVRTSYTHLIMILGIVVTSMGAEILISRPLGEARAQWSAAILAGPFLYLGGRTLYAWAVFRRPAWRAPVGMLIIAGISPAMLRLPPLAVAGAVSVLLLGIVLTYHRLGPRVDESGTMLERLLEKRKNPRRLSSYELFFDLAMIFALSRVSQRMVVDPSLVNAAESMVLLAAVYWVWVATAWSTNWFNPDEPYLRRLIAFIMLASLLMASAVPTAFGEHGPLFAGMYVAIHLVPGLILVPALRGSPLRARSVRVLIWFAISAVLWLTGAFLASPARIAFWGAAIVVDGVSAWFGWPVPKLSRTPQVHLKVVGDHIAERYRQIHTIALGTLVLLSGLAYSSAGFDYPRTLAFVLAFTTATLMLVSYFLPPEQNLGIVIDRGGPRVAVAAAYCHGVMIAGTVVAAAGAEMYIRRPLGQVHAAWSLLVLGGVTLYIVGRALYARLMHQPRRPWRSLVAVLVIAAATPGLLIAPPLVVAIVSTLVLSSLTISYWRCAAKKHEQGMRRRQDR
ncbi:low temperature requirement protein A [Micromonospora sp. NPDC050397]|uniref:low temperature requirement protein A n=1 Tax=Micromonospora sp. NPDC050397 TaxID=3364279 RepID=UPI00385139D0